MSAASVIVRNPWTGLLMLFVPGVELRVHVDACMSRAELHDERLAVFKVGSEDSESVTHY